LTKLEQNSEMQTVPLEAQRSKLLCITHSNSADCEMNGKLSIGAAPN